MIITFVGHSDIPNSDKVKELVKAQVKKVAAQEKCVTCYLGGYGEFDRACALACKELKQEYRGIELIYVTPYITLHAQKRINELKSSGLYDGSIYPPIENAPPKFAILKRNEWMVGCSDLVIAYINRSYGGAYRAFLAAKRRGKRIVNIYELI